MEKQGEAWALLQSKECDEIVALSLKDSTNPPKAKILWHVDDGGCWVDEKTRETLVNMIIHVLKTTCVGAKSNVCEVFPLRKLLSALKPGPSKQDVISSGDEVRQYAYDVTMALSKGRKSSAYDAMKKLREAQIEFEKLASEYHWPEASDESR